MVDDISFNPTMATKSRSSFLAVDYASQMDTLEASGILGLGPKTKNFDYMDNTIDFMKTNGAINKALFSLSLKGVSGESYMFIGS